MSVPFIQYPNPDWRYITPNHLKYSQANSQESKTTPNVEMLKGFQRKSHRGDRLVVALDIVWRLLAQDDELV